MSILALCANMFTSSTRKLLHVRMYSVQYLRRTSKCSSRGYFNYMYSSTDKSSAPVICVQYIWHKLICSLKEKFIKKILMYHLKQRFNFGVLDIFLLCSFFR